MPRDVKWARPAETREDDDDSDLIFFDRPLQSRKKSPGGATSAFHKAPRGPARRRLFSRVARRVRTLVREHVHPVAMSPVSLAPHRACGALAPTVGHAPANRRHRFLGRSTRTPRAVAPDVNVESSAVDPTSASDGDGFVLDSSGFALSLGENGYADADAAKLATRDVVASRYTAGASSSSAAGSESQYVPPGTTFEAQFDPGPAVASLAIFIAFAVVNRRVAAAVDRRQDRERAEEDLRQLRLKSLDGSADFDDVQEAVDRLERAKYEEAAAREMLSSIGGVEARVRMPQPLGKPISQVEAEEADVAERIAKIRERRREAEGDGGDAGAESEDAESEDAGIWERPLPKKSEKSEKTDGPPAWMNFTVGVVLTMLTWSFVGVTFSEDPAVGPAIPPEELQRQMEMR